MSKTIAGAEVYAGKWYEHGDYPEYIMEELPDKEGITDPSFVDVEDLPKILAAYGTAVVAESIKNSANGIEADVTLPDVREFLKMEAE